MVYATSGYLLTATKSADYKATELSLDVDVPTSTQIDVTVYQDYSGGTTADNSETLTDVSSGSYPLSNFETEQGSTYWIRFDLSTSDDSVTPTVNGATVVADALELSASGQATLTGSAALTRAKGLSGSGTGTLTGSGRLYRVGEVYATTELPDLTADGITPVDASVEDELTVPNPQVTDYGDVRVQARVTDSGDAYGTAGEVVVAHDGGDITLTDLLDGEKYDLRVRTETEHVTGAWAGVSAVTLLPAPGSVTVDSIGTTSATITWDDTADNEDDILVERRREYADGFGSWETIATKDPNTTQHVDGTIVPSTTYEWRVSNRTEHVVSRATTGATSAELHPTNDAPASGWYIEVDSAAGRTRSPSIVGTPQRDPSVNDLERVTVPVPKDSAWDLDSWDDAPVRVWHDGERLPVDTLIERRQEAGRTTLVCEGPSALHAPDVYEFSNTDVHAAVETVVSDAGLAVDVVAPETDNRLFASIDTENEFRDVYQEPGDETGEDTPVAIRDDGTLEPQQTCWVYEGENYGNSSTQSFSNGTFGGADDFSGTIAEDVVPDLAEIGTTFETEREIPSDQVGIKLRRADETLTGEFQVFIDGEKVSANLRSSETSSATRWLETVGGTSYEEDETGAEIAPPPTLSPGEHTITVRNIEVAPGGTTVPSSGIAAVDLFAVYDKRHTPTFPSSTNSDNALPGPSRYPTVQPILLHKGFLSATGGRFEGVFDDLSGPQEIAISNDYGDSYTTAPNSETVETDFDSPGPDIQLRVTLGSYGPSSATPAGGQNPQSLTDYDLYEDTRNSPPLTNDQFRGNRKDILTSLVDRGDMLWAAEWDRSNSAPVVRMANIGDLQADRSLDLVDYEWSTQTLGRQVERATINGGAETVRSESVTADTLNGNPLDRSNLIVGREQVRNANDGTVYQRGTDYEMNYVIGQLNPKQFEGNISDGEALEVDYEWKPEGDYAAPGWTEEKRLIETFVEASTDAICQSIAFYLVDRLSEPIESGTLTIPSLPAGYSVLEAIAVDRLPNRDRWTPRGLSVQDGRVELEVANRRRVQDVVSDLRGRLEDHGERI